MMRESMQKQEAEGSPADSEAWAASHLKAQQEVKNVEERISFLKSCARNSSKQAQMTVEAMGISMKNLRDLTEQMEKQAATNE